MPKIYTIPPGLVAYIGGWGPAGNDEPAIVPEAVAAECEKDERLRVERDPVEEPKKKRARSAQEE